MNDAVASQPGDGPTPSYHYGKDRLRQGESYPIGRSELDQRLSIRPIATLRSVYFVSGAGRRPLSVVSAHFTAEHRHAFSSGTTSLFVSSVPSFDRKALHQKIMDHHLDVVLDWLSEVTNQPETWRLTNHRIQVLYNVDLDGEISVISE